MKIEKKYLEIPFECINGLIIEPCLKFNSEGLTIKSFTESNTAMCIFELPKSKFIEYEFEGEETFKITVEMLAKIMKRIKTKTINLKFENQKIIIADEKGKEYAIAVMHDDTAQRDIPQVELNTKFEIESSKLQDIFLDAGIVSEEINLSYSENKLNISSGTLNKFKEELECKGIGQAKAGYSLDYLNKFMIASKYFNNVNFEFSDGTPCFLTFKNEDLEIKFILAPRVE